MSQPAETPPANEPTRFPLWVARRWYLYRVHRGSTVVALASTLLMLAAMIPLIPLNNETVWQSRAAVLTAGAVWIIGALLLARGTRLLVTGAPEHRHSATRLALGFIVPMLGAIAVGGAGVSVVAILTADHPLGARWIGVSAVAVMINLALALWACAEVSRGAGRHPRAVLIAWSSNLGALLALIALAVVVQALMSVLSAPLTAWIAAIIIAVIGACTTLASLAARALVGSVILAREVAELGPEIEPVSGP